MDKNTLFAFFLIALVLLLTPKYMELFSPQEENQREDKQKNDLLKTEPRKPAVQNPTTKPLGVGLIKPNSLSVLNEKLTTIETDLYSAVFSSIGGGTIKEFHLKNHFTKDSQRVNLANNAHALGPSLLLKDIDGNNIDLSGSWDISTDISGPVFKKEMVLEYSLELFPESYIIKTFVFYPGEYSVKVFLNLNEVKDRIYRDVSLYWDGSLATTEKDTADDLTYFKSYVYQGGELEELKVKPGETETQNYNGATDWCAIRSKYFICALIPNTPKDVRSAHISGTNNPTETYGMSFVFDGYQDTTSFLLFLGPLEYERVRNLNINLDEVMDFGWAFIRPISKGVLYTLKRMNLYIPNYGVVLIVFSFLVKILVFPLTKKSYQSTSAMQKVQPEINALRDKYKNNPQKLNQATMQLYKEKGVNPLGGCFPMLLQMPLLFALFIVFRTTIELRNEPFLFWISDLSSPDKIFDLPFTIPLYGSHVAFLPILMVISTFIQQKMMTGGAQQPQQKMMQYFMTGFFFLIFNNFPSGLNLYYTLFNVLTIAQQKLLPSTPQKTKGNV